MFTLGTASLATNFAAAIMTASLFVSSIYSLFTTSSSVSSVTKEFRFLMEIRKNYCKKHK
jgi:hypothetical protein